MGDLFRGLLLGLANIIPGVSGGTFALILGIYERLLSFLNSLGPATAKRHLGLLRNALGSTEGRREWKETLIREDWPFIARLGTGMLFCILLFSPVMKYLLLNQFELTYSFFFGLILVSFVIPWKMMSKRRLPQLAMLVVGVALTVGVAVGVNPYDKIAKKSELNRALYEEQQQTESAVSASRSSVRFQMTGKYTTGEYLSIFLAGVIAISAMVLPGISGSLVLILLGQYFAVLAAISALKKFQLDDILFLSIMAAGMGVGLLLISRIVEAALRHWRDGTLGFLLGLIAGSLYALWPFKEVIRLDLYQKEGGSIALVKDFAVHSNRNILPQMGIHLWLCMGVFSIGVILMFWFEKREIE